MVNNFNASRLCPSTYLLWARRCLGDEPHRGQHCAWLHCRNMGPRRAVLFACRGGTVKQQPVDMLGCSPAHSGWGYGFGARKSHLAACLRKIFLLLSPSRTASCFLPQIQAHQADGQIRNRNKRPPRARRREETARDGETAKVWEGLASASAS